MGIIVRSLALGAVFSMAAPAFSASTAGQVDGSVAAHCSGAAPVTCHFDVPPGNYKVTLELGGPAAASTSVWAEQRRLMLAPVATAPGHRSRQHVTINVRDPEGEPTGDGGVGTPGLDLRFDGTPAVQSILISPVEHPRSLFLAGDSTVCDQPGEPYTGWGQVLPARFTDRLVVANYADSGESSGSFLATPQLFATMQPLVDDNDYVFVQFGHNDKQTNKETYQANLRQIVEGIKARHATPVLVSPPVRRLFAGDVLTPTALHVNGLGVDLPAAMHELAEREGVPMIDLTARSRDLVQSLGPAGSLPLYLPQFKDNTHFSPQGAEAMADLVLAGARDLDLDLANFLR